MLELKEPFFNDLELERNDQHLYLEDFMEKDLEKFDNVPFHIVIKVNARYCINYNDFIPLSDEEEILTQDFEPPKLSTSFKPDKCVLCLSNEPNILFSNSKHICICLECEEINPLNSCPYCRSIVIEKNLF